VAANVLKWGTGGLNIGACRIPYISQADKAAALSGDAFKRKDTSNKDWSRPWMDDPGKVAEINAAAKARAQAGRFPANLILDGTVAKMLDEQGEYFGYSGTVSRFFYVAKASKSERGAGNTHPTVKPVKLMRYLVRLVTPLGGTVLDPFAGSGTTLLAAEMEGFRALGAELNSEYCEIAYKRYKEMIGHGDEDSAGR